jgi:hypothetical protein
MTTGLLSNPKAAGYFNYCPDNGAFFHEIVVDPAVEDPLPLGTAVELEAYSGPGVDNPPTYPLVQPTSTTADQLGVGIVVGGQSANSNSDGSAVPPGDIALIMARGICQVLFDATSVVGHPLVQSAATAGCLKTVVAADTLIATEIFGVALEAVTIDEGTALVWCYINKVG